MAGTICATPLQVCATRVSRLTTDGTPDPGEGNLYISRNMIQLTITPEVEAGDEFIQKNGCGELCVDYRVCDQLKRFNLGVQFCDADPELAEMMVGGTLLTVGGNTRGWASPAANEQLCGNGVSVEMWARNIEGNKPHPDFPYVRFVFPRSYWQVGERTLGNTVSPTIFAGYTEENENWGNGPGNDWPHISDRMYMYMFDTDIPDTACGSQELLAS